MLKPENDCNGWAELCRVPFCWAQVSYSAASATSCCKCKLWKAGTPPELVPPKVHIHAIQMHVWQAYSAFQCCLASQELWNSKVKHCIIVHKIAAVMIVHVKFVCIRTMFLRFLWYPVMKHDFDDASKTASWSGRLVCPMITKTVCLGEDDQSFAKIAPLEQNSGFHNLILQQKCLRMHRKLSPRACERVVCLAS